MSKETSPLQNERGIALFPVFLVLLLTITLGSSGLVQSGLDLQSTQHFATGNQAFFVSEAGILHGLNRMNQTGVIHFEEDIVDRWSQIFGASTRAIDGHPNKAYQIALAADADDPANQGIMTVIGTAPANARRVIQVTLNKSTTGGTPGTIYLAADGGVDSQFTGDAFEVNGEDHDMDGNLTGDDPVPGISSREDAVTEEVLSSLNALQQDNVQGLGFSLDPLTPSVMTTGGPTVDDLDQITSHILEHPNVTTNEKTFNGTHQFGSIESPQITYMTDSDVILNGDATGAGILIADGSITVNGTLDFVGWIIVRGDTVINVTGDESDDTVVVGNATIFGTLWTGNLEIKVGGSAIVDYCLECLQLADNIFPGDFLMPHPMAISSWQEIF